MNLVGYTATALSRNDIEDTPTNKNVVDFAIVELKDLNGDLVVMYDDAEGANPETQKTCDTNGQVTFFAEIGDYDLEINGKAQRINLSSGLASFISTKTDESVQDFVDSFELKIFQSPTDGGLTEIQTRTVDAGEVYEVRKTSDDSLATIYSDSDGTTEIVQNGTSNVSDSTGAVEFYIADGDYYVEVGGVSAGFTVESIRNFDSVEDMVSNVNAKSLYGKTVETAGYYEAGDGGGAEYEIVAAGTGTDDGGSFIDLIGSGFQAKGLFARRPIDIAQFGAKSEDGFDNKPAIENCRDFAVSSGTPLITATGTEGDYEVSSPINTTGLVVEIYGDCIQRSMIIGGVRKFYSAENSETAYGGSVRGPYETSGELTRVAYNGDGPGYGNRLNYSHNGKLEGGFSIAHGVLADHQNIDGGQALAQWLVSASPNQTTGMFGCFAAEFNCINNSTDEGWTTRRGLLPRWTGGLQVVPESKDFVTGNQDTNNITFAYAVSASAGTNAQGSRVKSYSGLLIEPNAIAPGGDGLTTSGSTSPSPSTFPKAILSAHDRFDKGIDLRSAIFADGRAICLNDQQSLSWGGGNVAYRGANGAREATVEIDGATNLRVTRSEATPSVNYVTIRGHRLGGPPSIRTEGEDTDIDLLVSFKGAGSLVLPDTSEYADNDAAISAGLPAGAVYHTGGTLKIVI